MALSVNNELCRLSRPAAAAECLSDIRGQSLPKRALEVVRRVLRVEPESPRARALEALLLSDLGRGEEALHLSSLRAAPFGLPG